MIVRIYNPEIAGGEGGAHVAGRREQGSVSLDAYGAVSLTCSAIGRIGPWNRHQ
jgi:hypothetical protein